MSTVTPLYNFNDLCGPLGQRMADDGRVGTLRVSTVKNLDSLDEDVMVKQVLDGMMRKCGSQDEERHTWLLKWKPLAEQALETSTKPPFPPSVLKINPLPEHFVSVTKVMGGFSATPTSKKIWGRRTRCGTIFLAGLGYHDLNPEDIKHLVPVMPKTSRDLLQSMKVRLIDSMVEDSDMYVVAHRSI